MYLMMLFISLDITIKSESLFSIDGVFSNGDPMGIPLMVKTFSDGTFVLYEYDVQELKKFDKNGNYIESLSRRGRGPGEFIDIDHIFIDGEDQLFVVDHIQLKLTAINPNKEKSDHLIFESRPRIRSFHQTKKGEFIIGFINYSRAGIMQSPELYYLFDENLKVQTPGFVPSKDLHQLVPGSTPEVVMRGSTQLTDNSVLTINDDLLVVPALYNGRMLLYSQYSNYDEYEVIEVSNDYGTPYEEFQELRQINQRVFEEEGFSMVNNPAGRKIFFHYNRSLGLFKLNTGHIVHFAQIKEGNGAVLIVEIFDEEGRNVLSTQKMETLGNLNVQENVTEYRQYSRIDLVFHHLDHLNRLFISRFGEYDMPELHVIQLDMNL